MARLDCDGDNDAGDEIVLLWMSSSDGLSGYLDLPRLELGCTLGGSGTCLDSGYAVVGFKTYGPAEFQFQCSGTPAGSLLRFIDIPNDVYGDDHIQSIDHWGSVLANHGNRFHPARLQQEAGSCLAMTDPASDLALGASDALRAFDEPEAVALGWSWRVRAVRPRTFRARAMRGGAARQG